MELLPQVYRVIFINTASCTGSKGDSTGGGGGRRGGERVKGVVTAGGVGRGVVIY